MDIYETVKEAISDHLIDQPYDIKCAECGEALSVDKNIDNDGDLYLEVTPCESCLQAAREEGAADATS